MKGQAAGSGDGESGHGSLPCESSLNHCPGAAHSGNRISRDAAPSDGISNLGCEHYMSLSITCCFFSRAWVSGPAAGLISSLAACVLQLPCLQRARTHCVSFLTPDPIPLPRVPSRSRLASSQSHGVAIDLGVLCMVAN